MQYKRMPIEIESPEEMGYGNIKYNLAESSVRDINLRDVNVNLNDLVLFYGEHRGTVKLREAILENSKVLSIDDVLVTTGAATALFIISTTLLDSSSHIVVLRPNYATNIETPRAIGCPMTIIDVKFEDEFNIDIEAVRNAMQANTKLISITNPHNPTGKLFDEETIKQLIAVAEEQKCFLLIDETYRDLNFQTPLRPYYAELSENVISVSSVSKSYGAPGVRIGWLICRNNKVMKTFFAGKEQICLCNSVVDEEIAFALLSEKQQWIEKHHATIRENFALTRHWFGRQPHLEWIEPKAGVVCFPRLKSIYNLDVEKFYDSLYKQYGTIVGPGHWFERDKIYMRIGFAWPTREELEAGLNNITSCIAEHIQQ